jgi:hypothetical protein
MKKCLITLVTFCLLIVVSTVEARARYGDKLCSQSDYYCIKVKQGDSWYSLFPDDEERDIVRRVNRLNLELRPGMRVAVPKNLHNSTIYDHSPFPRYINSSGEKAIYVSQQKLAWAAYDKNGELLWWGPISSGTDTCRGGSCHTPGGSYRMIRKQDIDCISSAFPKRADGFHGGAPMPYCMHFFRGYALHGAPEVPGYRASHGCVRLFVEDARWLNEEFIDLPEEGYKGTKVIIEPLGA